MVSNNREGRQKRSCNYCIKKGERKIQHLIPDSSSWFCLNIHQGMWNARDEVCSSQWLELMRVAQQLHTQVMHPFHGIGATRRGQASWICVWWVSDWRDGEVTSARRTTGEGILSTSPVLGMRLQFWWMSWWGNLLEADFTLRGRAEALVFQICFLLFVTCVPCGY